MGGGFSSGGFESAASSSEERIRRGADVENLTSALRSWCLRVSRIRSR